MDVFSPNATTYVEVALPYDIESKTNSIGALVIVLVLVVLTIFFEKMKHSAEHRAGRALRPIVETLFGELTVLGFLSMVTYCLNKAGVFLALSRMIFNHLNGEEGEDEGANEEEEDPVLELVETIHFSMFFVMVVFLVTVLFEVHDGLQSQKEWCQWHRACHDEAYVKSIFRQNAELDEEHEAVSSMPGVSGTIKRTWRSLLPYLRFLPFLRDRSRETLEDKMEFCSLRLEFLRERSCDPPFTPAGEAGGNQKSVGDHFNFGRYLTFAYAKKMTHVVEIDVSTWLLFAGGTVCYFLIYDALRFQIKYLAWAWVLIGWIFHVLSINFEKYLLGIRDRFLTPQFIPKPKLLSLSWNDLSSAEDGVDNNGTEKEPLRKLGQDLPMWCHQDRCYVEALSGTYITERESIRRLDEGLPVWCYIDIDKLDQKRSKLIKALFGPTPQNRQHALYLFGSDGPAFHTLCLRIMLVFSCIYSAQLVTLFVPTMIQDESTNTLEFFLYCTLALVPALDFIFNKKRLIATVVQVGSIGPFILPQAIADSEREEKTSMAVRVLVVYFKLARLAEEFLANPSTFELAPCGVHYTEALSVEGVADLVQTFTSFMHFDGDGCLSGADFQNILNTLGVIITESEVNELIRAIMKMLESTESLHQKHKRQTMITIMNSAARRHSVRRNTRVKGEKEIHDTSDVSLSVYALFQLHFNQRNVHHDKNECAQFLFDLFDVDKSGDITVLEFKQQLDKLAISISHEEAYEFIQELDLDGNGVLSKTEFEEMIERFYPVELWSN